ncbi:MAG: hypothetical protein HY275_18990 [Gemmatimonadetes bacterium]|nr:hypothetical protein [Gemmatimonadota bacterium]
MQSDDDALRARFALLFGECATDEATPETVRLTVARHGADMHVTLDGAPTGDLAEFVNATLPGHGWPMRVEGRYVQVTVAPDTPPILLPRDGRTMIAPVDASWRALAGNLAVSAAIARQPGLLFLHAASARIGDAACLACGPKRRGKTTLALALGIRGHGVYGDELAALRLGTGTLVAVRRALSVRDGPAAAGVTARVAEAATADEHDRDGERRTRAAMGRVVGARAPAEAPVRVLLLLRSFGPVAMATPAVAGPAVIAALTPLGASLWGRASGPFMLDLLRWLGRVRIFHLDAGPPDETAALVERLMETG